MESNGWEPVLNPNPIPCHMRATAEGVEGEICLVATPWARVPCPVAEKHCRACLEQEKPRDRNPVTASIAISQIGRQLGRKERKNRWEEFRNYIDPTEPLGEGAGRELFGLLKHLGVKCEGCPGLFRLMNRRGTDWCLRNEPRIVEALAKEARKRGWEFSELEGKRLVGIAIKKAREKDDSLHVSSG